MNVRVKLNDGVYQGDMLQSLTKSEVAAIKRQMIDSVNPEDLILVKLNTFGGAQELAKSLGYPNEHYIVTRDQIQDKLID